MTARLSGLDYEAYSLLPGVRASRLKLMGESGLHYRDHVDVDSPSRGKLRAIHSLVLEPENAQIAAFDGSRDKRTSKYREFLALHGGMTILTPREYDDVHRIRDGIFRHELAASILNAPGRSEESLTWTDEATGLPCKARLDRIHEGGLFVADLKTYGTSDPRKIAVLAARLGAHIQAAHYCAGVSAVYSVPLASIRYVLICAEEKPPFDVAVVELEYDNALAIGRNERDRLMGLLAGCIERDEWPGRCPDIVAMELPAWVDQPDESINLEGAS